MSEPSAPRPDAPGDDKLLDHEYDGIKEYDNPMPKWWLASLWGTVIFAVLYLLNVAGIGIGRGRIADYEADVAAQTALKKSHDPMAGMTDERLAALAREPAQLAAGRTTFTTMCGSCHGADGGGIIGPNLTDDFWLHGGKPTDILRTVNGGVLEKGMPAWGQVLPPDQVLAVVAYVTTLHGTHPRSPKAPQGVRADSAPPAPAAPAK
jgi:cytochrome c oxidase cbb3-type subunit 3